MRAGRRCTKALLPPSGYSRTSTWAENPLTCVKKPTFSVSAGIDTWKYFAWMIGGEASVRFSLEVALAAHYGLSMIRWPICSRSMSRSRLKRSRK